MARENQKFTILYEIQISDGQRDSIMVYFDVKEQFSDTLEEFQKKAMKHKSLALKSHTKDNVLDKEVTSHNDILDAFRLALRPFKEQPLME
jgi:capsule polysaccharide modification protein KpsS